MSREVWQEFICSTSHAGRHLSSIGKGVKGAKSDPIDLAVLRSFLDRLYDAEKDVRFLSTVVDLLGGGYSAFMREGMPRLLTALSNEVVSREEVVGPGLRGNPLWQRTLIRRGAGTLPPARYVSRTAHRSFEMPENELLSWLIDDLARGVRDVSRRVSTNGLHPDLAELNRNCDRARRDERFGRLPIPPGVTQEMFEAARRHRKKEYRTAASLAKRRLEMTARPSGAWWHSVLMLVAVDWLEPVNDDALFELYVLILTLDILSEEMGLIAAEGYGLVTRRRSHIAEFRTETRTVRVHFNQTWKAALQEETEYTSAFQRYRGLADDDRIPARRPDIIIVDESGAERNVVVVEVKETGNKAYTKDSIYRVFAYLYDFGSKGPGRTVKAILVVPTGIGVQPDAAPGREFFIASGDDRPGMAAALRAALEGPEV